MRIVFVITGLAMLGATPGGRVHVFFPETQAAHGVEHHALEIRYTAADGRTVVRTLDDAGLDLSAIASAGAGAPMPVAVFPLESHAGLRIPATWMDARPPAVLRSRVSLPRPTHLRDGKWAGWIWERTATQRAWMPLTNRVWIELDVPAQQAAAVTAAWRLTDLRPGGPAMPVLPAPRLRQNQPLYVFLTNVPAHETKVPPGQEARHFRAYLRALGANGPFPRLSRPSVKRGWLPLKPKRNALFAGASPLNCMLAWAPVDGAL